MRIGHRKATRLLLKEDSALVIPLDDPRLPRSVRSNDRRDRERSQCGRCRRRLAPDDRRRCGNRWRRLRSSDRRAQGHPSSVQIGPIDHEHGGDQPGVADGGLEAAAAEQIVLLRIAGGMDQQRVRAGRARRIPTAAALKAGCFSRAPSAVATAAMLTTASRLVPRMSRSGAASSARRRRGRAVASSALPRPPGSADPSAGGGGPARKVRMLTEMIVERCQQL